MIVCRWHGYAACHHRTLVFVIMHDGASIFLFFIASAHSFSIFFLNLAGIAY